MPSGYDNVSVYYDRLARIIFGNSIRKAQAHGLSNIVSGSNVLIVGGGTGYVLEQIGLFQLKDVQVDYVEASTLMINQAKMRSINSLNVNFIDQPIQEYPVHKDYDVIITQFFLDSFEGEDLEEMFLRLDSHLRKSGLWLVADFQTSNDWNKNWQKMLLSIMYLFFKLAVGISAHKLENFQQLFQQLGYHLKTNKSYYAAFIFSSTFQKRE
jgi:ubiquinone/menaquinone biosynthesis C-methylase UbiE